MSFLILPAALSARAVLATSHRLVRRAQTQKGFTLIELMVSLGLGLVISIAAIAIFLPSIQLARAQRSTNQVNETALFALDHLSRQLRSSGYVDWMSSDLLKQNLSPLGGLAAQTNPVCMQSPLSSAYCTPPFVGVRALHGCSGAYTNAGALLDYRCAAVSNTAASLTVAYQALAPAKAAIADPADRLSVASLEQGFANTTGFAGDCTGSNTRGSSAVVPGDLAVNRYYLDTLTQRLMCRGNGNSAALPLAHNVEQFTVRYGVAQATPPAGVGGFVSQTLLGGYMSATEVEAQNLWNQISVAEVCLLVRGEVGSARSQAGGSIFNDCLGTPITLADGRLRRTYRTLVDLRSTKQVATALN